MKRKATNKEMEKAGFRISQDKLNIYLINRLEKHIVGQWKVNDLFYKWILMCLLCNIILTLALLLLVIK